MPTRSHSGPHGTRPRTRTCAMARLAFPLLVAFACAVHSSAAPLKYEPHEHSFLHHSADPAALQDRLNAAFNAFADPTAPFALDRRGGDWISRWLSMGGEGELSVEIPHSDNLTLPHRPAAFPEWLAPVAMLPLKGVLVPFTALPPPVTASAASGASGVSSASIDSAAGASATMEITQSTEGEGQIARKQAPERACLPPTWPPIRGHFPTTTPYTIALVERGGCDFATKVRAAQERGAAAVIVGDSVARDGETDEEGRMRENLITMYSPEDTNGIIISSVFVSRASYLLLRDVLAKYTIDGHPGVYIEIGEPVDDGSAFGSLLTFALLMPSLFLIVTVVAHRVRVARQREANRAPPTVVLSLPERVWTPDIVWEKDDSDSDKDTASLKGAHDDESARTKRPDMIQEEDTQDETRPERAEGASEAAPDASAIEADDEAETETPAAAAPPRKRGKERRASKRYYSKDECAICMDNFHRGEVVRILPCGHVFHKDECDEWLLKWRKLCPTCRADVTIPPGSLSGSATLTPVVERTASPEGGHDGEPSWVDQVGARLGGVFRSVSDSLRAAVRRDPVQQSEPTERTPLVGSV